MITALLIALIASFSQPIFTIDKLPKEIRKNVSGKAQKTRLLYLTNEGKKKIKQFRKEEKKANKIFQNILVSEENSILEIEKHYDLSQKRHKNLHSSLITTRLEMQQLITDTEWNNITNSTVNPSKKKLKKINKAIKKRNNLTHKKFDRINEVIQTEIQNSDTRKLMSEFLKKVENDVFKYMEILIQHSYRNSESARDHNASKIQLEQLLSKERLARNEVITSFLKFYKAGSKNVSITEWNTVKKSLKLLN